MKTEVLIIGAGPTGLALSTTLHRAGVDNIVIDRSAGAANTSRAAVIHAHTLEVLDSLGVTERLNQEGLRLQQFSIRDRDRRLLGLRFDRLPGAYPQLLMLPQDRTEAILSDALAEAGGKVHWNCSLTALQATVSGMTARIDRAGNSNTVTARYVVGADGMHSQVRQFAGIGFSGSSYEHSFVLADVDMQWPLGRDEVSLFFSPNGLLVVAPLPGNRRFRIVATCDEAPESLDVEAVQQLVDARGPTRRHSRIESVLWGSRFRLHHRVADHYRLGPVFLIGDAAHVHSPAGGQGMNTGLVDACVLGRMLADVLQGRRVEAYLNDYEALRRPAALKVLGLAGRLTEMATAEGYARRVVRNGLLRLFDRIPPAKTRLAMNLSGLSRRDAASPILEDDLTAEHAAPQTLAPMRI